MAKQSGIIKLQGKLDDISFYHTGDGHLARKKGGVDAARIKSDPKFARVRENNAEFGNAADGARMFRRAIKPLLKVASDGRMISRLMRTMFEIKNLDTINVRGRRNVGEGIQDPQAHVLLKDFQFNRSSELGEVLQRNYQVNTTTGVITINDLIPVEDLSFPAAATHVTLKGAWLNIDFSTGIYALEHSNEVNLPIDATQTDVVLTPAALPTGTGLDFGFLTVAFYQEVNGVQYSLKNGLHNALAIVAIV